MAPGRRRPRSQHEEWDIKSRRESKEVRESPGGGGNRKDEGTYGVIDRLLAAGIVVDVERDVFQRRGLL